MKNSYICILLSDVQRASFLYIKIHKLRFSRSKEWECPLPICWKKRVIRLCTFLRKTFWILIYKYTCKLNEVYNPPKKNKISPLKFRDFMPTLFQRIFVTRSRLPSENTRQHKASVTDFIASVIHTSTYIYTTLWRAHTYMYITLLLPACDHSRNSGVTWYIYTYTHVCNIFTCQMFSIYSRPHRPCTYQNKHDQYRYIHVHMMYIDKVLVLANTQVCR